LFGVGLALIPVILNAVAALTRQEPNFTLEDLFVHGELLLVSAAVVGAALAELFDQARPRFRVLRIVTGGFSVLLICGASVWFADIAAGIRDSKDLDAHFITMGSLGVFLFAIVAGTSCLVLAQLEERDGR
jgi:heme/copper-type cytochrome/quinol oxidase subunit 3